VAAALASEASAAPTQTLLKATSNAALRFAASRGAASAGVSLAVGELAQGVLSAMIVTKIKAAALIVLTLGLATGVGVSVLDGKDGPEGPGRLRDPGQSVITVTSDSPK
jgi:hypothetical protein